MLRTSARYGLLSVVAMSGLAIALRVLLGPFDSPVRVRTPLNPEGWFGLALTILLAINGGRTGEGQASRKRPSGWWSAVPIAALVGFTTAAFWRTIHFYFLSDDFVLVNLPNKVHFAMRPLFATAGGDGFFRPIGYISLALSSMWAGANPVAWHATALALHVANVVLVFMLATRLCASRLAAFFAAALFAIHGTRPEAAAWIAGRFDLTATFFMLAGLLLFLRSYGEPSTVGYIYELASLMCMVLAILSKESAFIFPVLLVVFLIAKRDLSRSQISGLVPFFMTAAALFVYRWRLFGGIGGYRDPHTGQLQALTFGVATLKALALRLWTALYFPINWRTEPGVWLAALMLAYMGALVWLAISRPNRAMVTLGLGFTIVSAIPPIHLLVIGAEMGNSRLLYLPSVGFCIMLAVAADALRGRVRWLIPGVVLAFHVAALQHNLNEWEYVSDKARAASAVAVECIGPEATKITDFGVPGTLRGVPFFANVHSDHLEFVVAALRHSAACPLGQHASSASLVWDGFNERLRCVEFVRQVGE